jgi:hypothetical protein
VLPHRPSASRRAPSRREMHMHGDGEGTLVKWRGAWSHARESTCAYTPRTHRHTRARAGTGTLASKHTLKTSMATSSPMNAAVVAPDDTTAAPPAQTRRKAVPRGPIRRQKRTAFWTAPAPSMTSSLRCFRLLLTSNTRHDLYRITAAAMTDKHATVPPTAAGMEMPREESPEESAANREGL